MPSITIPNTKLARFFENSSFPPVPEVASKLLATFNNDNADPRQISALIARDPGITASVLKQANSAMYGAKNPIASVTSAVQLLGTKNIQALALGVSVMQAFPQVAALPQNEFWNSSQIAANFANLLAAKLNCDRSHAWLSAFIFRLGELLIATRNPDAITMIEKQPRAPGYRWKRELDLLEFTEGEVVAEIARLWHFPDEVVDALAQCTNPKIENKRISKLSGIVRLSGLLADGVVLNVKNSWDIEAMIAKDLIDRLGLDFELVKTLYTDR